MRTDEADERDLDRELNEFLQELRVMLPGVQVLLAFLLTVPFTNRFVTLSGEDRAIYFLAVVATSLAIVLLMTPGVQHRMRFREHDKEALLQVSNRIVLLATLAIGVAIGAVAFLITEYLYGVTTGVIITAALGAVILSLWYAMPWSRRRDRTGGDTER
jgi:O-antigen/teichoic acid export membrane protein